MAMESAFEGGWPRRVAIVGLGLIGGSLALAAKRFRPETSVIGVDFPEVLSRALGRGAIDAGVPPERLEAAVAEADLVVLATPILTILKLLDRVVPALKPGAVVTDVGSTKLEICRAAGAAMGGAPEGAVFVGGHPLAGSEAQGIEHAQPLLFENALYVLTPPQPDAPRGREGAAALRGFLESLGALVVELEPERHDQIVAYTSHLPQLLAVALVNVVGARGHLDWAAGGFRDLTRVAASPFGLWRDILSTNAPRVRAALEALIDELQALKGQLEALEEREGTNELRRAFERAARFRKALPVRPKGLLRPCAEVAVWVPDRPGALAEITAAVARAGVNIKDIELLKVREGLGGTFRLGFETPQDAQRVVEALQRLGYESWVLP